MYRCLLLLRTLVVVGSFAEPMSCGATTRRVPSEYATINAALDASSPGESVLVAPGIYEEYETRLVMDEFWLSSVGFLRSEVVLESEGGAGSTTLLMNSATAEPVVLSGFEVSGSAEVSGFTFSGVAPGIFGIEFSFGGHP